MLPHVNEECCSTVTLRHYSVRQVCMCLSDEGLLPVIKLAELITLFCMDNSSVCCVNRAPRAATHWLR